MYLINELFKKKREEKGLTQGQLARKMGYKTPQFISNCERHMCRWPKADYKVMMKVLGVNINEFADAYFEDSRNEFARVIK